MHTGLSVVLLALLGVSIVLSVAVTVAGVRGISGARRGIRQVTARVDRFTPDAAPVLVQARERIAVVHIQAQALDARLATAAAATENAATTLWERRRTLERMTEERLLPMLTWITRMVAVVRFLRLRRVLFG